VRPSPRSCSMSRTVSVSTKSRLGLASGSTSSMSRTSICSTPPGAAKALKRAKALQAAERLRLGPHYLGQGKHVIVDDAGRPYHPDTLSDFWRELCGAAKVRQIRLHDARHSCASIMHAQSVPIAVISAWLGHADPAFSMRTYVHAQDGGLKAAAATLQKVVTRS
jgi:integrase